MKWHLLCNACCIGKVGGTSNSQLHTHVAPRLPAHPHRSTAPHHGCIHPPAGSVATRRLASRLVPRFVHLFPHLVDGCATALIGLHQGTWQPEPLLVSPPPPPQGTSQPPSSSSNSSSSEEEQQVIIRATREDALQGLAEVLHAAMKHLDKAVPTVVRVVQFLFR
jgi:hypothetical protein